MWCLICVLQLAIWALTLTADPLRNTPLQFASDISNNAVTQDRVIEAVANYGANHSVVTQDHRQGVRRSNNSDTSKATFACYLGQIILTAEGSVTDEYIDSSDGLLYENRTDVNWYVIQNAVLEKSIASDRAFFRSALCWLPSRCILAPKTANGVALAMKIISFTGTKFAVRSGGHSPNPHWASVGAEGVLVDLSQLDMLYLSDDKRIIHVGTGRRWSEVYRFLNGTGVSAAGARVPEVGVGGQLLGGSSIPGQLP